MTDLRTYQDIWSQMDSGLRFAWQQRYDGYNYNQAARTTIADIVHQTNMRSAISLINSSLGNIDIPALVDSVLAEETEMCGCATFASDGGNDADDQRPFREVALDRDTAILLLNDLAKRVRAVIRNHTEIQSLCQEQMEWIKDRLSDKDRNDIFPDAAQATDDNND